jgi:hypothetical protein
MGKYTDIGRLLNSRGTDLVRIDFEDIEEALGFNLPASAHKYAEWWANNYKGHVQARAWMDAGWHTESLDLDGKKVTFRRSTAAGADTGPNPLGDVPAATSPRRRDPWGCMAGTVTFMTDVDLTEPTEEWDAESEPS